MTDLKKLVKKCAQGQRDYQKALYDRYSGKMLGICMRYARDKSEAEDFVQEGFIKVFKNIKSLRNPNQLEGWMEKIMVNTALEHIRKNKRTNNVETSLNDSMDVEEEEQVTSDLSRRELLNVIQSLPAGFRAVFNMYAIEGYSHKEISKELGISEGTSKSQYARAKTMLQQKIKNLNSSVVKHLSS